MLLYTLDVDCYSTLLAKIIVKILNTMSNNSSPITELLKICLVILLILAIDVQ